MKFGTLTFLTTLALVGVPAIPVRLAAQSASSEITNFEAPGAGAAAGSGSGTFPTNINASGTITGHYTDAYNVNHGFLRTPGGKFITFDAPGAGAAPGSGSGTFPTNVNDGRTITGHYNDANNVNHGFLRTAGGKFITFDAPGAGAAAGSGFGTFPTSISNGGIITGYYVDANNVNRGFLRTPGGEFTAFEAPGAGAAAGSGSGTFPKSINDAGAVTGHYTDATNVNHGFLLNP
jgi:hypothetical protein